MTKPASRSPEIQPVVFIPLTQGKVAVIDFEDWDRIRPYTSWRAKTKKGIVFYARGVKRENGKQVHHYLHRVVLGITDPKIEVGHKDGDGLNCRRNNICPMTNAQNQQGKKTKWAGRTSRFRGVSWNDWNNKWMTYISVDKKRLHLGYFKSEEDAARAYDAAALKYFGEFAAPNFEN